MQADQWYRQLVRSHENMQQLVGTQDPTSPLEADWDSSSFTTEQSGQAEPDTSSWTAGQMSSLCPTHLFLCVCSALNSRVDRGELTLPCTPVPALLPFDLSATVTYKQG